MVLAWYGDDGGGCNGVVVLVRTMVVALLPNAVGCWVVWGEEVML